MKNWIILTGLCAATPAYAALQALGEQDLADIAGAQGITLGMKGEMTYDLVYDNNTNKTNTAKLKMANMGGDFQFADLKIDIVNLGTTKDGVDTRALQISLPSKISGKKLGLGDLSLSVSPFKGAKHDLPTNLTDAPVRQTYQAVVTASNYRFRGEGKNSVGTEDDVFNSDLGVNQIELHIADMGGTRNPTTFEVTRNAPAKLQIESWHTYGDASGKIDATYLTAAETERARVAPNDKGNLGMHAELKEALDGPAKGWQTTAIKDGITQKNAGTNPLGDNEYFFTKGVHTSLAGKSSLGIGSGSNTTITDPDKTGKGMMRETNINNNKQGQDKTSKFAVTGQNVAKYTINLTSRIDQIDSDKFIVGYDGHSDLTTENKKNATRYSNKTLCWSDGDCFNNARYEGNHNVGQSTSSSGQGGCYGNNCEARPLVDGLSWYTDNPNYKAVSAEEYTQMKNTGAQMAHDPRVIFSVGKQTEVRLQAMNLQCNRWCGYDFDSTAKSADTAKPPRPAYRQATVAPAIVLLDDKGNVMTYDTGSGGSNVEIGGDISSNPTYTKISKDRFGSTIHGDAELDDHGFYPMARIDMTLGDPLVGAAKTRFVSGTSIQAPPERTRPLIAGQNSLNQNISFKLGGSAQVFGIK